MLNAVAIVLAVLVVLILGVLGMLPLGQFRGERSAVRLRAASVQAWRNQCSRSLPSLLVWSSS